MNDKKQIEKMGRVLSTVKKCDAFTTSNCIKRKCEYPHYSGVTCIAEHQAEALYNANCRILDEGSVVLSKEEIEIQQENYLNGIKYWQDMANKARKQAAKEIIQIVMSDDCSVEGTFDDTAFIKIMAKKFGVEVEDAKTPN